VLKAAEEGLTQAWHAAAAEIYAKASPKAEDTGKGEPKAEEEPKQEKKAGKDAKVVDADFEVVDDDKK
jgi:hypothetical protein